MITRHTSSVDHGRSTEGVLYGTRFIYKIKPVFIEDTKDILSEHRSHLRG
nr:MAG TPA: hypothetical protein [Caudoviricetes sp.]